MVIAIMLFVGVLAVVLWALFGMRRFTMEKAHTEARLLRPETPTVSYAVPNGQDPAVLMAALETEGFTAVCDTSGGMDTVVVECGEQERGRVRAVIEQVDRAGFNGPELHVGHVSFEDER